MPQPPPLWLAGRVEEVLGNDGNLVSGEADTRAALPSGWGRRGPKPPACMPSPPPPAPKTLHLSISRMWLEPLGWLAGWLADTPE